MCYTMEVLHMKSIIKIALCATGAYFAYYGICALAAKCKVANNKAVDPDSDITYETEYKKIVQDPSLVFTGWKKKDKNNEKPADKTDSGDSAV